MINIWLKHLIFDQALKSLFDPLIDTFKSGPQSKAEIDQIIDNCILTGFMPVKVYTINNFVFMDIRAFDNRYSKNYLHIESDNHIAYGTHRGSISYNTPRNYISKILI